MKMSYVHGLGHNGEHVHNLKYIYTGKYIGVLRDEYKLHDVTMSTDDVIKYHKKKASNKILTGIQSKDVFTSIIYKG